jgi:hypothetical protein
VCFSGFELVPHGYNACCVHNYTNEVREEENYSQFWCPVYISYTTEIKEEGIIEVLKILLL